MTLTKNGLTYTATSLEDIAAEFDRLAAKARAEIGQYRMALIDAIESRKDLAAGDPERREFHTAYVAAYRKLYKRRFGSDRTPMELKTDDMSFVKVWPR
jgi:hypothetical protein